MCRAASYTVVSNMYIGVTVSAGVILDDAEEGFVADRDAQLVGSGEANLQKLAQDHAETQVL